MGFLDMAALDIDPDKIASPTPGRQTGRPASHERVEHGGAGLRLYRPSCWAYYYLKGTMT